MDYFSATITVAFSLIYAILRVFNLQTPTSTSKLAFPAVAIVSFFVITHFNYLLSFPLGQFPYGYHTKFVVILGMANNLLWIVWSLSFALRFPKMHVGPRTFSFPQPYPPNDPLSKPRPLNAMTPLSLVLLTLVAMSFELMDFRPLLRVVDAHSVWHGCTVGLAIAWWSFFTQDAIDVETGTYACETPPVLIRGRVAGDNGNGGKFGGPGLGSDVKSALMRGETPTLSGGASHAYAARADYRTPVTPAFAQMASLPGPPRRSTPTPRTLKGDKSD
jgi:hypothetical protein